jgi:hypothetical protein
MFHAGYVRGTALNAAVGIDELRDLMMTLKRTPRSKDPAERNLGPAQRSELWQSFSDPTFVPYLNLGPLTISLRRLGSGLIYEVFSRRFPTDDRRVAVLVDGPAAGSFGALMEVWFGNERGLKRYELRELDKEGAVLGQVQSVLRRIQSLTMATLRYRAVSARAATSREAVAERAALQRTLSRETTADGDLAQILLDLGDRLSPRPQEPAQSVSNVFMNLSPKSSARPLPMK